MPKTFIASLSYPIWEDSTVYVTAENQEEAGEKLNKIMERHPEYKLHTMTETESTQLELDLQQERDDLLQENLLLRASMEAGMGNVMHENARKDLN